MQLETETYGVFLSGSLPRSHGGMFQRIASLSTITAATLPIKSAPPTEVTARLKNALFGKLSRCFYGNEPRTREGGGDFLCKYRVVPDDQRRWKRRAAFSVTEA